MEVPSLLVEVVWRTHLLRPAAYLAACERWSPNGADSADAAAVLVDHTPEDAAVMGAYTYVSSLAADSISDDGSGRDMDLGMDLVAAVRRQQAFMRSMLIERQSFDNRGTAEAALSEYHAFLGRIKHSPMPLTPSVAVDWIWHTHMLFPHRYVAECLRIAGSSVDHNDDIESEE